MPRWPSGAWPASTGAHCYEFFASAPVFDALQEAEPGTFYLTDYLARHFDALVMGGLGLDRHPELRDAYFGHYRRVVHLAQTDAPEVADAAEVAAGREARPGLRAPTTSASAPLRSQLVRILEAA